MRMSKKCISMVLASALTLQALGMTGCGNEKTNSPDSLTIQYEGESVETIEILYGTEDSVELTAVLEPADYEGDVTWASNDAEVAKVESTDGDVCSLTLLKVGNAKITASCGETTASVQVKIGKNEANLETRDIAYTIGGTDYSVERVNIAYVDCYQNFVSRYGDYCATLGLDTSGGVAGLVGQGCDYSDDETWRGYFLDEALDYLVEYQALCDYAAEQGITLDEEDLQDVEDKIAVLESSASTNGYTDMDEYAEAIFGDGATMDLYRQYLESAALAMKTYLQYRDDLTYTDQEIADHYAEMGYAEGENDYPMVSMRHILIMAEADSDGNYTDEAIQAAHDKAEEIYEEWKSGAADEDSFAELANEYTDDTGSNTNGGSYEDVYKDEMVEEVNDFLFAEGRQAGDTAVVDHSGTYTGSHVLYFCGEGELYSTYLSRTDLQSDDMQAWIDQLLADYTPVQGEAASEVGEF